MRAVLGTGCGLGLPVLAKGLETPGELKFPDAEACEIGQSYYLGKPTPIETFDELKGNGKRTPVRVADHHDDNPILLKPSVRRP